MLFLCTCNLIYILGWEVRGGTATKILGFGYDLIHGNLKHVEILLRTTVLRTASE